MSLPPLCTVANGIYQFDDDWKPYGGPAVTSVTAADVNGPTAWGPADCSSTNAPDRAVNSICMVGADQRECGGETGVGAGCVHLTEGTNVIFNTPAGSDYSCWHPGDDDSGSHSRVSCPANAVLTGFGVSGANLDTTAPDGQQYQNVAYCAAVTDKFVVDRSNPTFLTSKWGHTNETLKCPDGMVITSFCNQKGYGGGCTLDDDPATDLAGWIRCDTVKQGTQSGYGCGAHGTMTSDQTSPCNCKDGFTSTATGWCVEPPAGYCNGGMYNPNSQQCACSSGFKGPTCTEVASPPSSPPASPAKSPKVKSPCQDGIITYGSCVCNDGFSMLNGNCTRSKTSSPVGAVLLVVLVICVLGLVFAAYRKSRKT
jgi:hypothetical protein